MGKWTQAVGPMHDRLRHVSLALQLRSAQQGISWKIHGHIGLWFELYNFHQMDFLITIRLYNFVLTFPNKFEWKYEHLYLNPSGFILCMQYVLPKTRSYKYKYIINHPKKGVNNVIKSLNHWRKKVATFFFTEQETMCSYA